MSAILGSDGKPVASSRQELHAEIMNLRRQVLRGKYDAAQTNTENELHWSNADNLDPHAAASPDIRQKLRSRSRYEVLENNPYLKGTLLTLANDFVGVGGPKLRITDSRVPTTIRQKIERRWRAYSKAIRLRQKLWQMRLAKIVDGETFAVSYLNPRIKHPVQIDYTIHEADQITSQADFTGQHKRVNEIDGIRFDDNGNPTQYHRLHRHPGNSNRFGMGLGLGNEGKWINADFVRHWFRKDRGWLRGIPETTPSLPHCSILRRYTLAIVRWAETAADMTGIITTDGPAANAAWTDGAGTVIQDDPFDTFPIDRGMLMNLPWGYDIKQLDAVPLGVQFDEFVAAILREIVRPLLAPYNIASGSSKDYNMSSGVLDTHIYKGGQYNERSHCEEEVVEPICLDWWIMGIRTESYFDDGLSPFTGKFGALMEELPDHEFSWDRIGIDHTDPSKVANAIETLRTGRVLTDRDIQEDYFNRSVEDWQEQVLADDEFRQELTDFDAPEPEESLVDDNSED